MRTRAKRRVPRSRREIREGASTTPQPAYAPPPMPAYAPQPVISGCLHYPYECSVYRYPPQWCSSCQVRAASICAQSGMPDIRHLFRGCVYPIQQTAMHPQCNVYGVQTSCPPHPALLTCPSPPLYQGGCEDSCKAAYNSTAYPQLFRCER